MTASSHFIEDCSSSNGFKANAQCVLKEYSFFNANLQQN